jgi:hypothetical protein
LPGISSSNKASCYLNVTYPNSSCPWFRYTSVVDKQIEKERTITVSYKGELPQSVNLYIEAEPCSGPCFGKIGHSAGKIQLDTPGKFYKILQDIGSSYTGTSKESGHRLIFSIVFDSTLISPKRSDEFGIELFYEFSN